MDRIPNAAKTLGLTALLAAAAVLQTAGEASAQRQPRRVYNPVTKQSQPERRPRQAASQLAWQAPAVQQAAQEQAVERVDQQAIERAALQQAVVTERAATGEFINYEAAYVEPAGHHASCGCGDCLAMGCGEVVGPGCGGACGDIACGGGCCPPARIYTGFEFTFVKARFEQNVAFTEFVGNGTGGDTFTDTEFDYDLVLTPRVFLGWEHANGLGLRATWWHFDNNADQVTASPDDSGFGRINHPEFANLDISSTDPNDILRANSHLNAYAIDLEATHTTSFCGWDLGVAGGVRYAFVEQGYRAEVETTDTSNNNARVIDGSIDYLQSIEGFGPTISLSASRPLTQRASLFGKARGSLLFGDGEARLSGGEEITNNGFTFTTDRTTNRDDVMSVAEMQVGFRWQGGEPCYTFRPFLTLAMEGQVWNGAGSATSEDGTLGFFGFSSQLGFEW